jgi:amino acid permease
MAAKASFRATTINIITGGLGAGILSLPWAVAGASIINSVLLNALVLGLNSWTIMLLIHAAEKYQKVGQRGCSPQNKLTSTPSPEFDLGSLLEMLPRNMAKHAKLACNVAVWFSMFLCLVGYIIVIEDAMMNVLPVDTSISREAVGAIFGLVLIPVCFLPMR